MSTPEDAARADFVRISSDPHSTERYVALLRLGADAFPQAAGTLELGADRIMHIASKTGPTGIDDSAALRRVAELAAKGLDREAVGIVAREIAALDPRSQVAIAHRLREKLRRVK